MWYAIFTFLVLMVLLGIRWCLFPHGRLPRFRVRYLRIRLLLRLHPGRGHASVAELWLRWGRFAMFRRSRGRERSTWTMDIREAPPFRRRRSRNSPTTVRNNPKTRKAGTTIQVKMLM